MITPNTTCPSVESAQAAVAEAEAQLRAALKNASESQAHADALPVRLAAGDESVTTDDLIQAGPVVAVANAHVRRMEQNLATTHAALQRAQTDHLIEQLRGGTPFMQHQDVQAELDRIGNLTIKHLGTLAARIDAHNKALSIATGTAPKNGTIHSGSGGDSVSVSRESIEVDGQQWGTMPTTGHGAAILRRIEMAEALARDAATKSAPRDLTDLEFLALEQAAYAQQAA